MNHLTTYYNDPESITAKIKAAKTEFPQLSFGCWHIGCDIPKGSTDAFELSYALAACPSSFKVTPTKYSIYDDLDGVCKNTFGQNYRLADWNDIVTHYNNGAPPDDILAEGHVFVSRNGDEFWSGDRHYIGSRNNHSPHPGYLSHANIDNHLFDLGSWYSDYCVLCYNEDASSLLGVLFRRF